MAVEARLQLYTNRNIYIQSDTFQVTPAFIDTDSSFNMVNLTDLEFQILNGANLLNVLDPVNLIFNMQAPGSVAILFQYAAGNQNLELENGTGVLLFENGNQVELDGSGFATILYIQIISAFQYLNQPDFFYLVNQETPKIAYNNEQYDEFGNVQPVYTDNQASAFVLSQLYNTIYGVFSQIYPDAGYTSNWEYALNGTNNIFAGLTNATQLLTLLNQAWTQTALNVFDLELFLTKYIFFRTGQSVTVYINDNSVNFEDFWIIGYSSLGINTKLSPGFATSTYCIVTFFSDTLGTTIQNELIALLQRFMRADIAYTYQFLNPSLNTLNPVGYTYPLDARLIYTKALQYTNGNYPFNLLGYN